MANPKITAVKGMSDLLPAESAKWQWVESRIRELMRRYGYAEIRTPIVEPTPLFVRGLGEVTDIVEKEMYSFVDAMNGDALSLRPENTAGVVRAAVEHSLLYDGGKRLWYCGPQFRHERPQKGRSRQFHQFGVEALGFVGPDVDAEVILMCRALWRELGLMDGRDVRLELNCLGQPDERRAHREALVRHFEAHADQLDDDAKRRLHTNPLRILDTKNPAMQAIGRCSAEVDRTLGRGLARALRGPVRDARCGGAGLHREPASGARHGLLQPHGLRVDHDAAGRAGHDLRWRALRRVVRTTGRQTRARYRLCVGARARDHAGRRSWRCTRSAGPDAYAIVPGAAAAMAQAMVVIEALRAAGCSVVLHAGGGSMKSQFKRADASGASFALIFGDEELAQGMVAVKPLRAGAAEAQGTQVTQVVQIVRPIASAAQWAHELRAS